jgi:hypothetical protein
MPSPVTLWSIIAFSLVSAVAAKDATAEAPKLAHAGTLTCTTQAQAEAPRAGDENLSCSFKAQSGPDASFLGHISRRASDTPAGKRVLVWSVMASNADVSPEALAGTYAQGSGAAAPGQLVGGRGGVIVLQPMTVNSEQQQVSPTVLEIRLEPVRA